MKRRGGKENYVGTGIVAARAAGIAGGLGARDPRFDRDAIAYNSGESYQVNIRYYVGLHSMYIPTFHCVTPSPTSTTSPADSCPEPHCQRNEMMMMIATFRTRPIQQKVNRSTHTPRRSQPSNRQFSHVSKNAHRSCNHIPPFFQHQYNRSSN